MVLISRHWSVRSHLIVKPVFPFEEVYIASIQENVVVIKIFRLSCHFLATLSSQTTGSLQKGSGMTLGLAHSCKCNVPT